MPIIGSFTLPLTKLKETSAFGAKLRGGMVQSKQRVNVTWVSGSNGSQFWMDHMGHGSQYVVKCPCSVFA